MSDYLSLLVPAGYSFDYYAILLNKKEKGLQVEEDCERCALFLSAQIGPDKFEEILGSDEFLELLKVNSETFDAVDLAEKDEVPATMVTKLNNLRAKKKQLLHKKFFSDQYKEVKNTGYEKL